MNISEIAKLAGVSSAAVSRYFNNGYISEEKKEAIRKEALLDARESLEKALDIKGLGPMRKAEIRKKYKKAMEEKEHGRKTGTAGGC